MRTDKPTLKEGADKFVEGVDKTVSPAPAPQQRQSTPAAATETTTGASAAPAGKIVKFPLEMPEELRKTVKRHVIDLDGITMNTYIVDAIRAKLAADGVDVK
jgi:hypothetical protein